MRIVALDLATTTGVAIGAAHDGPLCHTERLGKAGEHHGARFSEVMFLTKRLIAQHKPDLVAIEAPVVTGAKGDANRALLAMGLRGCVMGVCTFKGVSCQDFNVLSIRAHFLGNGRIKRAEAKAMTIERCRTLGWHVANDNEADAAALWDYARAKLAGVTTPTPFGFFDGNKAG